MRRRIERNIPWGSKRGEKKRNKEKVERGGI